MEDMSVISSNTEDYRVVRLVAQGTFGEFFMCQRESDSQEVAVKKVTTRKYPKVKEEIKILTALWQKNEEDTWSYIQRFYEAFGDKLHRYLVFETLEMSLYELQEAMDFTPFEICEIRTITYQMLRALTKLRRFGIIHADLKPENIMIVNQRQHPYRVKLGNFRSAYFTKDAATYKPRRVQTRYYRSPEILLGLPFCARVDIWSLGCVMAELCLGYPLYPATTDSELMEWIVLSRGMPGVELLRSGMMTRSFFDRVRKGKKPPKWHLKTVKGRPTKSESHSHQEVLFDKKEFMVSHWNRLKIPEYDFQCGPPEAVAVDHRSMVDLIRRMLTVDPRRRIDSVSALRHPFITMEHLRNSGACQRYRSVSVQALRQAVILPQSGPERQDNAAERSASSGKGTFKKATADSTQRLPKSKKGSLKKSFFTCFCVKQGDESEEPPCFNTEAMEGPHCSTQNVASVREPPLPSPLINEAQGNAEGEDSQKVASEIGLETSSSSGESVADSCSSMKPEVSSIPSDISLQESSLDLTHDAPRSKKGSLIRSMKSFFGKIGKKKKPTPSCSHSDPMEGPHDMLGPQETNGGLKDSNSSTNTEVPSENNTRDTNKAVFLEEEESSACLLPL
ncbi:homeodomain-interacting protein kinase 4-like [Megalops cyprinoides]|uniref:homeodomain-interacting protein kinase 4-like n=1 Tax=Megalops cyprinoides TaxID=118141 RepID=UPI001864BECC|nr:homeodomain-interacting protein kinase 4-like [Megalops cyprinoides]